MNAFKQRFCLVPTTLLILACCVNYFTNKEHVVHLDSETLSQSIDTTVLNLTIHQFNEQGELINQLTTPKMEHIAKGDIHLLQTPHILITQNDQPAWDIRSLKAKSFEGGKRIVFSQQVVAHQEAGEKTQESLFRTEEITYYPKRKQAVTDQPVTYEQAGNFIQSIGMHAYLDQKRVVLLHQARGRYDPAKG